MMNVQVVLTHMIIGIPCPSPDQYLVNTQSLSVHVNDNSSYTPYDFDMIDVYINQPDVLDALHVSGHTWQHVSDAVYEALQVPKCHTFGLTYFEWLLMMW
jgi:hypothetical protein